MPPKEATLFPTDSERAAATTWIRSSLKAYEDEYAGDPGRVTVRRLTSAEYAYAIRDLTGIDIKVGIDASSDSVGGEGFANFGDVQFVQDASVERYLEAAKLVADHAVDRRRSARLLHRYRQDRARAVGAQPHRRSLRHARASASSRAKADGRSASSATARRSSSPWYYKHRAALGDPTVDAARRWRRRKASPAASPNTSGRSSTSRTPAIRRATTVDALAEAAGADVRRHGLDREGARRLRRPSTRALTTWPSWFFARGDLAAGGAGDESPLVFDDTTLKAEPTHHYTYPLGAARRARTRCRAARPPGR